MGTNTASMRNTVSLLFHIIEVTLQTNLFGLLLSHKTLIHIQKNEKENLPYRNAYGIVLYDVQLCHGV